MPRPSLSPNQKQLRTNFIVRYLRRYGWLILISPVMSLHRESGVRDKVYYFCLQLGVEAIVALPIFWWQLGKVWDRHYRARD